MKAGNQWIMKHFIPLPSSRLKVIGGGHVIWRSTTGHPAGLTCRCSDSIMPPSEIIKLRLEPDMLENGLTRNDL